jgi:hypothetical protein
MKYELQPFDWRECSASPPLEIGEEAIRLSVNKMRRTDSRVELEFHASYMFPNRVAKRYKDLNTALVLVLADVETRDGFAVRTIDDFIKYAPGKGPPEQNLITPPPLPLAPRGDPSGESHRGSYLNGALWFESVAHPTHRPSVFLYLVLENFVSNTVGLDLVKQRVIAY